MTLRQYLFIMIFATLLCFVSLSMVLTNIDPFQGSTVGFLFFYVSVFFALLGTLTIVSFICYRLFSREGLPMFRYVKKSFHTGMFFAALSVGLLYLQMQSMLNLWNFTLFVLVIALFASFSLSAKSPREGIEE